MTKKPTPIVRGPGLCKHCGRGEFNPDWATHPGQHIAEIMEVRELTQADLSRLSGIPRGRLSELLSKKRGLTAALALRLEKVTGYNAEMLMRIQVFWDLHHLRNMKAR